MQTCHRLRPSSRMRLTRSGALNATNDSGVIYLPNGELLAISVYVKAGTRNDSVRDRIIARIARAAFGVI